MHMLSIPPRRESCSVSSLGLLEGSTSGNAGRQYKRLHAIRIMRLWTSSAHACTQLTSNSAFNTCQLFKLCTFEHDMDYLRKAILQSVTVAAKKGHFNAHEIRMMCCRVPPKSKTTYPYIKSIQSSPLNATPITDHVQKAAQCRRPYTFLHFLRLSWHPCT